MGQFGAKPVGGGLHHVAHRTAYPFAVFRACYTGFEPTFCLSPRTPNPLKATLCAVFCIFVPGPFAFGVHAWYNCEGDWRYRSAGNSEEGRRMAKAETKERAAPIVRTEQGAAYMRGTCLDRNGRYAIHRVTARQVSAMVRRGFRFVRHGEPEAERIHATGIVKDASGDAAWFGAALPVETETAAVERALKEAVGAERADAYLRRLFNTV